MIFLSQLRAIFRLIGFVVWTLLWTIGVGLIRPFYSNKIAKGIRDRLIWLKVAIPMLGVRIFISGEENLKAGTALYVANHRSYIDPVVALRYAHAVIVTKAEVSRWPLIGTAVGLGSVLFVNRTDKESRSATLEMMEAMLVQGFSLCVFPEGTTTRYPEFLPFRPGSFRLAAAHQVPVVPMAMEFSDVNDAWTGSDTFVPHFFRTFRKRRIDIYLSIGPQIVHHDHEVLMTLAHDWIANELEALRECVQKRL